MPLTQKELEEIERNLSISFGLKEGTRWVPKLDNCCDTFKVTKGGYDVYVSREVSAIAMSAPDGRELVVFPDQIFEAFKEQAGKWVDGELIFPDKSPE